MAGLPKKLSRKQEVALSALLSTPSVTAAAEQSGMSETTLYRWLRDETFRQAYQEARHQLVSHGMGQLQKAFTEAVRSLREIVCDAAASPNARVSAARVTIENSLKALELEELESRISALETDNQL